MAVRLRDGQNDGSALLLTIELTLTQRDWATAGGQPRPRPACFGCLLAVRISGDCGVHAPCHRNHVTHRPAVGVANSIALVAAWSRRTPAVCAFHPRPERDAWRPALRAASCDACLARCGAKGGTL